jgi:hypothetical protein
LGLSFMVLLFANVDGERDSKLFRLFGPGPQNWGDIWFR